MKLKNCKECGRIFTHPTRDICDRCRQREEDEFKKVKEYLWQKKGATIEEVHEATEVDRKKIIKFIREGRLIAEGLDVEIFVECQRCGEPILFGNYCSKCLRELEDSIGGKEKLEKKALSKEQRMHLRDRLIGDKRR
ncbi:MAG: flagellar protein [Halanaerobium sp.]|nr:flagellar protein [Halanaerobium sp.]